jgi:multidrug transporter EmrE-like cation transporter
MILLANIHFADTLSFAQETLKWCLSPLSGVSINIFLMTASCFIYLAISVITLPLSIRYALAMKRLLSEH